jgi:hypothetical protein
MRLQARADDGALVDIELPGAESAAMRDELARRWPPQGLTRLEPREDTDVAPPEAARRIRLGLPVGEATWERFESELGLFTAEHLHEQVAVHAALVVVDGAAIVLPGRSFTGKTTLGLALAAAGASLASDEFTLIDPTSGLVTGWARPARVRVGTASRREPVTASVPPAPVALVAFLRHVEGATLEIRPITRATAVIAMLDETVCARSRPDPSLDAAMAATHGTLLRGVRGEATQAATWLLDRLAESARTRP